MPLNERDCFIEKTEMRPMPAACPLCRHRDTYQVKWSRRTKKDRLPGGGDEIDRAKFSKLRDHLFRLDDFIQCSRCRRRFEIPSHRSIVFLDELEGLPKDDPDE